MLEQGNKEVQPSDERHREYPWVLTSAIHQVSLCTYTLERICLKSGISGTVAIKSVKVAGIATSIVEMPGVV